MAVKNLEKPRSRRFATTSGIALLLAIAGVSIGCSGEFLLQGDGPDESPLEAGAQESVDAYDGAITPGLTRAETEYAAGRGVVREVYFAGSPVTVIEVDGEFVYEGDILLPQELVTEVPPDLETIDFEDIPLAASADRVRLAARIASNLWPNNTVYYTIDPTLDGKERVFDAIDHWQANTNLRFVERTTESDYVLFRPGSGCSSYVGRVGGNQPITLASACSTGNVIHEIGHAVGAWHEHSRADRDASVRINWDNIYPGVEYNFHTYSAVGFDGQDVTESLDFGSIMMYSPYAFSANGQPTIEKLDGSLFSAQRSGLSAGDIAGLDTIYPSQEVPEETGGTTEETGGTTEETGGTTEETGGTTEETGGTTEETGGTTEETGGTTEETGGTTEETGGTTEETGGTTEETGGTTEETGGTTEETGGTTEETGGTTEETGGTTEETGGTTEETGGTTEPEYVNGEFYVIAGLRVLYQDASWYFFHGNNFKEVVLVDGRWYYVRGHKKPLN